MSKKIIKYPYIAKINPSKWEYPRSLGNPFNIWGKYLVLGSIPGTGEIYVVGGDDCIHWGGYENSMFTPILEDEEFIYDDK